MSRLDFLYRTELPHRAVAVYIYLADRTNENNECWPAIPTIASDLKLSPSTVRRGIRDLKKAGLLETEQRYRKKGGKSSLLFRLKKGYKRPLVGGQRLITAVTIRSRPCFSIYRNTSNKSPNESASLKYSV